MTVYMLRAGNSDAVKIGHATNLGRRLSVLQSGNPFDLVILRTLPGAAFEERWLHHHFRDRRIAREWFRYADEMMTVTPTQDRSHDVETIQGLLSALEDEGAKVGLRHTDLSRLAGIDPTTWWRAKNGRFQPQYETWTRLQGLHKNLISKAA